MRIRPSDDFIKADKIEDEFWDREPRKKRTREDAWQEDTF
jgi:hypothetical protein